MDPRLQLAIENDDVDELHRLIVEERKLLDRASNDPFPNTPLHVAAASGKTQHYHTVRVMMTLDSKLIRIRGRCGITSLHYVAGKEGDIELELLAEFLSACKSSIEDLTNRCETVVHIAVKNHNLKAFKFLFGWLKRVHLTQILEWKDQDGNMVLHIVASEGQFEIINLLIGYTTIKAKNFQGKTALEIFQMNPTGDQDLVNRLHRLGHEAVTPTLSITFFSRELTAFEKCVNFFRVQDESARNISCLIAAATYQAALTLPGGNWQDDSTNPPDNSTGVTTNSSSIALGKPHQAGDAILSGLDLSVYAMCNSLAFFASIATIWATTFTAEANPLFYIPMPILCVAYFFSLLSQIPEHNRVTKIPLKALVELCLLAGLVLPLRIRTNHIRVQRRIDVSRRCVATFEEQRIQRTSFYLTILITCATILCGIAGC
ncbi:LOW QUALITY PROTEIN: hypothetical protein BT93_D0762 [Corymbia citriodora subsp. variegata]|nr:LOW QUALITY PROTEIN: hypothetical protein BT93_D0762 [Corymbia citriodora subsp. variegata]